MTANPVLPSNGDASATPWEAPPRPCHRPLCGAGRKPSFSRSPRMSAGSPARRKTFHHPEIGQVALDCDAFAVKGTDLNVIVYTGQPAGPTPELAPS